MNNINPITFIISLGFLILIIIGLKILWNSKKFALFHASLAKLFNEDKGKAETETKDEKKTRRTVGALVLRSHMKYPDEPIYPRLNL